MLPEREIEKAKQDLIDLHKRCLVDYLMREGLSYAGRIKFFRIYDHYISKKNITEYFFCPVKIFIKALIKDKLDLIKGVSPMLEKNLKRYRKRKHRITISF